MANATQGQNGQFTYDFGIKIAQGTLGTLTKLTGVTLTLAGALYALKSTATEYVDTLRENTIQFGGVLSTMQAMQQAQERLIKGQSYFAVDDQLRGMKQLQSIGLDVGENMEFMNKAAHAMGKSFSQFTQMVVNATNGSLSGLIDAGLLTQRSAKMFAKYKGNYIAMRGAIVDFLKNHKGLANAIENDFSTIADQSKRMKESLTMFWQSVLGKPNEKGGLYWTIVQSKKAVNEALARNMQAIRSYGAGIGVILTYTFKQIGKFILWLGRKGKQVAKELLGTSEDFAERMRSFVVWLEFWKLRMVKFFREYGDELKAILKLLIAFKVLSAALTISQEAIHSVRLYKKAWAGIFTLRRRYFRSQGPYIANWKKNLQSLAVFLPRPFRKVWVWFGKQLGLVGVRLKIFGGKLKGFFVGAKNFLKGMGKFVLNVIRNLRAPFSLLGKSLPKFGKGFLRVFSKMWKWIAKFGVKGALKAIPFVGWVLLAIDVVVLLYKKLNGFKQMIHGWIVTFFEFGKMIANIFIAAWVTIRKWAKKVWNWIKDLWADIKNLWNKAVDWIADKLEPIFQWLGPKIKKLGEFLNEWIVEPIKKVWGWLKDAWTWASGLFNRVANWIGKGNTALSDYIYKESGGKYSGFKGGSYTADSYFGDGTTTYGGTTKDKPAGSGVTLPGAKGTTATTTKKPPKKSEKNPLIPEKTNESTYSGSSIGTAMEFASGAIVVNVYGGDTLNEEKIAKEVKKAIKEIQREGDMRGGV